MRIVRRNRRNKFSYFAVTEPVMVVNNNYKGDET